MPVLRLGDLVPNFRALSTFGPLRFYDWQGENWVLFMSHPADFTPVCTTELSQLVHNAYQFEKRNVKLLAHSCNNLKDHLNWIRDIKTYSGREVPFPIIADETRDLAVELNMLDFDNKDMDNIPLTVRAMYVIDPKHRVQLSAHYPNSTGRSVSEMLRVIDSLQLCERIPEVVTPMNWQPNEEVLLSPTVTDEEARQQFGEFDTFPLPSGENYLRSTNNYLVLDFEDLINM